MRYVQLLTIEDYWANGSYYLILASTQRDHVIVIPWAHLVSSHIASVHMRTHRPWVSVDDASDHFLDYKARLFDRVVN